MDNRLQPTWAEIVAERQRKEDEAVARRFYPYRHLGRGHMQPELCRVYDEY